MSITMYAINLDIVLDSRGRMWGRNARKRLLHRIRDYTSGVPVPEEINLCRGQSQQLSHSSKRIILDLFLRPSWSEHQQRSPGHRVVPHDSLRLVGVHLNACLGQRDSSCLG